eukprot:6173144-Pleurochrysis_carterae.AAC.2
MVGKNCTLAPQWSPLSTFWWSKVAPSFTLANREPPKSASNRPAVKHKINCVSLKQVVPWQEWDPRQQSLRVTHLMEEYRNLDRTEMLRRSEVDKRGNKA